MRNLISIVGKNLKIISRSRLSTFLVLLAPILIVFLVGTAFSSETRGTLDLGVYSSDYGGLTESILENLSKSNFIISKTTSESNCIETVKSGKNQACIIFPPSLSIEGNEEEVLIHIDNSRINLAYILVEDINSQISSKSSELGVALVDDLIDVINAAKDSLPDHKSSLNDISDTADEVENSYSQISISSIDSAVEDLEDALDLLDGVEDESVSDAESEINDVLEILVEFRDGFSGSIDNISESNDEMNTEISKAITKIDSLISDLNKIDVVSSENIVNPIKTKVSAINKGSSNWNHLFPTLVSLIVLMSGTVLASSLVLADRKSRARFRNFMTPTSDWTFILGTYITGFILLFLQIVILFLGTVLLTSLNISNVLGNIALIMFISSSVFIFLGMIIGYMFNTDEKTILASISVISLFIFFSNTIIPSEIINGGLRYFAVYNPFSMTDTLLKKTILFGESLSSVALDLGILSGVLVLFAIITLIFRKMSKRRI